MVLGKQKKEEHSKKKSGGEGEEMKILSGYLRNKMEKMVIKYGSCSCESAVHIFFECEAEKVEFFEGK